MIGGSEMRENKFGASSGASKRNMRTNEGEFTAVNISSTATNDPIQRPHTSRSTRYQALACGNWAAIALPRRSGFRVLEQSSSADLLLFNILQEYPSWIKS